MLCDKKQMHVYRAGEFDFAVCEMSGTTLHTLYNVFALGAVLPFWKCLLAVTEGSCL